MLPSPVILSLLVRMFHAEDVLTAPEFGAHQTKPVICTIEQVHDDGGAYHNGSRDILSSALEMAASHIGFDMLAKFELNRNYVTPDTVLSIANGEFVQKASCASLLIMAKCHAAAVMSEMATEMELVHVLFNPDILSCRIKSRYLVDLATSEERFIEELRRIVKHGLRWRRVLLIHDHLLKSRGIYIYKIALSKASVKFKFLPLENITSETQLNAFIPQLKQVFEVIVFLKSQILDLFTNVAANNSLFLPHHQWFFVSDTTCRTALGKAVLKNSTTIMLKAKHYIGTADYLKCPGQRLGQDSDFHSLRAHLLSVGIHLLLKASTSNLSWSCLDKPSRLTEFPNIFTDFGEMDNESVANGAENEPLVLTTNEGQVTIDMRTRLVTSLGFEYCSSDSARDQGYTYKDDWEHIDNFTTDSAFENVFTDFGGATLIVATNPAPPFVIKTINENQLPEYTGFCFDLLNELARRLKFSYNVVEPDDGQFGSMKNNSSWSGLVGMIINKEVTMGVAPVSITSERKSVIHFTTAFAEDGIGILTRRPGFGSGKMFRLFKPFECLVWFCLGCSVIITSVVLHLINKTSPSAAGRDSDSVSSNLRFFHTFWAVLACSVMQGTNLDPTSHSARLVLGFWWVFIIIVVSTYTASLAAVLTVTVFEKAISGLSELAEQSEVSPLIKPGTNLHTLFQTATNDVYRSIASRLVIYPEERFATNEKAMLWVKERNMAFMTDRSQLEYAMQEECEAYALADEMFNSGGLGFVVPKDAPFLKALNLIIVRLRQSGILEGWRRRWWTNDDPQCSTGVKVGEGQQLDLVYLAGPFFVFISVMLISGLVAACDWAIRTGKLDLLKARLRWWVAASRDT